MKETDLHWSADTFSEFMREHDIKYADIHIENRVNHAEAYDSKNVHLSEPSFKIIANTHEARHGLAVKADGELNADALIVTAYEVYPARIDIREVTKAIKKSGGIIEK